MSERIGLDPEAVADATAALSRGVLVIDGLIGELVRSIRAAVDLTEGGLGASDRASTLWSLPAAAIGLRRLEEAETNAVALVRALGEQVERQRAASSADEASYALGAVSVARAAGLYPAALRDPAVLDRLTPVEVAALFRRLAPQQAAELAESWPEQIGGLEGAPYSVRDAANRAVLQRVLDDPTVAADAPNRLAAEQTARALDDAAARGLGPVQLVTLELPVNGSKSDMRAAISIGDLDRAADIGVMVPGMNSNVEDSMRNLVWNAGNMQEDAGRPRLNPAGASTAVVAWIGYESPTENPIVAARFVGNDHLAEKGSHALVQFLGGLKAGPDDVRVTVLAHSYGTRLATYALSDGGCADALVMYGSPGIAETVHSVADLTGVPIDAVYSTKSKGDLLSSTGDVLRDAIRAGLTSEWGSLGVDALGQEMSNADGRFNADPNDASFGAKVFATDDTPGHGLGEEGGSYAGYWGRSGVDSLDNGARIMLGREPVFV